ncbi:MAG: cell division protein SepF [Methanobrevibacter sp.]|uniref:cell division protein SepF n=1 Tax=Methanobrevibacter sp. TaxID=66852 RepID=UPI0025E45D3F|nr:cell division protein SepF [Methanobrevibacter sp.]MBQ6098761.1 cell division protein SepF [Methanobrevibacter sp.]
MSFMDDLKRSLGFEETETLDNSKESALSNISAMFNNLTKSSNNNVRHSNNNQQYRSAQRPAARPNPNPSPNPQPPAYDDDDFVIIPEQSFYEIVLIRPKTIDDINYVVDQVIEENNPVILDLSFLEKESAANFKLAGEKIKQMRARYGVQALLLARTDDKDLIVVSPKKVRIINKG